MVEVVVKAEHPVKALGSVRVVRRVLDSMNVQAITEFMEQNIDQFYTIQEIVDITPNFIRIRISDPKKYARFAVIWIDKGKGIKATLGIPKSGKGSEVQSYMFDKKKWTTDRAKAWVKKHEAKESMDMDTNQFNFSYTGAPLSEAQFDFEHRSGVLTVITKGWSKNGYYYTDKALEGVNNFLNTSAKRFFADHNEKQDLFKPRKMEDLLGEVQEAWIAENAVKVKVKFYEHVGKPFIIGLLKEAPDKVGPSIVGKAVVRDGEIDGQKGKIVESVSYLHAFEIVAQPAAGGKADVIYETTTLETEENVSELTDLKGKIRKSIEDKKRWDMWYKTTDAFDSIIRDLVFAERDYMFISVEDRKKLFKETLLQFEAEVLKLKFAEPKEKPVVKGEETSEGYRVADLDKSIQIKLYPANAFKQGSISNITNSAKGIVQKIGKLKKTGKLAVHSFVFNKSKGWIMATVTNWLSNNKIEPTKEGVDMEIEIKNLADLKALDSTLYDSLVMEATTTEEHKEKVKKLEQDSQKLSEVAERVVTLEKETTELKEAKEKAEKERDALQAEANTFEAERTGMKKKDIILKLKKDAKLSDEHCSEVFDQELEACDFETEEKFSEAVKVKIADRMELVVKVNPNAPVITGAGHPQKKDEKVAETKYPFSNEDAAKMLKKSN